MFLFFKKFFAAALVIIMGCQTANAQTVQQCTDDNRAAQTVEVYDCTAKTGTFLYLLRDGRKLCLPQKVALLFPGGANPVGKTDKGECIFPK